MYVAVLVGAMVLGLAGCGGEQGPAGEAPGGERETRMVLPRPQPGNLRWNNDPSLSFSPDGSRLAYLVFQEDSSRQIHVRDMAAEESRPVPGTEGGDTPFFSPDGEWLGFFADGSLKKVALSGGGAAVTLTPKATNLRGATWGPNETIVFNLTDSEVLYEVSAAGGEPRQLTTLGAGEMSHRWPAFLPDGKAVIFTIGFGGDPDDWHVAALRLDTGERKVLVEGGTFGRYLAADGAGGTGHLVYHRDGAIMAVRFDAATLELMGTPARVFERVLGSPPDTLTGVAQFVFATTGAVAYVVPVDQTGGVESYEIHVASNGLDELRQRAGAAQ
jgi:serine/threonine-protein kinase